MTPIRKTLLAVAEALEAGVQIPGLELTPQEVRALSGTNSELSSLQEVREAAEKFRKTLSSTLPKGPQCPRIYPWGCSGPRPVRAAQSQSLFSVLG